MNKVVTANANHTGSGEFRSSKGGVRTYVFEAPTIDFSVGPDTALWEDIAFVDWKQFSGGSGVYIADKFIFTLGGEEQPNQTLVPSGGWT